MIAENTIRKQIQIGKQQKIITAVHLFFKYTYFKSNKTMYSYNQDTTILSGNNYYLEQENWVFRERARQNSIIFFDQLAPVLGNTYAAPEQKMEYLVLKYVELLFEKPDFAAYLITDLMNNPNEKLSCQLRNLYEWDRFFVNKNADLKIFNSFPVFISLIGMVLLPFAIIYSPENNEVSQFNEFENLIEQRKKLLPVWIKKL